VDIGRQLLALRPILRLPASVIENRLAEWRRLLRQNTTGRAVLQRILKGRILFTPEGPGYAFEAPTRFDRIFAGVAFTLPPFVDRNDTTGKEDITMEETGEAEWGRRLDAVLAARQANDALGVASLEALSSKRLNCLWEDLSRLRATGLQTLLEAPEMALELASV
jgi:hypothetical protein